MEWWREKWGCLFCEWKLWSAKSRGQSKVLFGIVYKKRIPLKVKVSYRIFVKYDVHLNHCTCCSYNLFKVSFVWRKSSLVDGKGHPPSLVNFTERLYEKKGDPFSPSANICGCSCYDCLDRFNWVNPTGGAKGEKLAWLGGWPSPSQKNDLTRCVTLPY